MALCRGRTGRWTDRVEDVAAWVLLAAGLLVVLLGCVLGIGVHDRLADQARVEALDRTPVDASLLNASPTIGSDSTLSAPLETAATWRDRSGVPHTGTVPAPQGLEAGCTVSIWIDRSGSLVREPTSDGDALVMATITWRSPSSREQVWWPPCGASCGASRCPTTARHGNGNGARSPRSGAAVRAGAVEGAACGHNERKRARAVHGPGRTAAATAVGGLLLHPGAWVPSWERAVRGFGAAAPA
jgi:hypothetical protein